MSLTSLIKQIEEAHAQSTQGEWSYALQNGMGETWPRLFAPEKDLLDMKGDSNQEYLESEFDPDANFIAIAHNTTPRLIAVIKVLVEGLEKISKPHCAHPDDLKQNRIETALHTIAKADSIAKGEEK